MSPETTTTPSTNTKVNPSHQSVGTPPANLETKENKDKNYILAVALSYLFGSLGIDRFYLGYTATGVIKLLTFGGLGIWSIIDFIRIVFSKLKAKGSDLPLESYHKYAKPFKMVTAVLVAVNIASIIGFVLLFAYLTVQGMHDRADNQVFSNAQAIANEIETYIINENTVPNSLEEVAPGFDYTGIDYKRDSDTSFTFCATYQNDGTATVNGPDIYAPEAYTDPHSLAISAAHKAGQNCRTITPILRPEAPAAAAVTPVPTEASTVSAYAKSACGVSGVMNSPNTVTVANLSRSGQSADFTFKTQARNGGTLYTVSADAKVFDANCKPLDHSIIKDGDSVLAFVKADPSRSTYVTGESLAVGALIVQTP